MSVDAFNSLYQSFYADRWDNLKQALLQPELQVARWNAFAGDHGVPWQFTMGQQVFKGAQLIQDLQESSIPRSPEGVLQYYVMDPASIVAACDLPVKPGDRVLDMCAAPGGKSLLLAEKLFLNGDSTGELICNDLSVDRRERLKKVLQNYIPKNQRQQIYISGKDGAQFGLQQPESFDAVLLDAPCSGERHLLQSPRDLNQFSPKRSKGLQVRQYSLLCAAWLALRPGGSLLYSTCSIHPEENDGVIAKFMKKKGHPQGARLSSSLVQYGQIKTEFGQWFAPDQSGFGPIYWCRIDKKTES